jgi:two-component system nitrate/nitrite response regulator NarL
MRNGQADSGSRPRVLIVEDHLLFAEAITPQLEAGGIDVIGVVTTGEDAVAVAGREQPDVVLVDLGLPGLSGLETGIAILADAPQTSVLALTASEDTRSVKDALRAGFSGYLTKDIPVREFVDAVRAALGGQVVVSRRSASAVTGERASGADGADLLAEQLTVREREVLRMLVEGASGQQISRGLRISPNTVRTHVQSILTKLQVHSRLEAATFAVRHGIVEVPKASRLA